MRSAFKFHSKTREGESIPRTSQLEKIDVLLELAHLQCAWCFPSNSRIKKKSQRRGPIDRIPFESNVTRLHFVVLWQSPGQASWKEEGEAEDKSERRTGHVGPIRNIGDGADRNSGDNTKSTREFPKYQVF